MRILVMGAGALGSIFGGLLARAGQDVFLVGRDKHMRAIRDNGLKISGLFGDARVRDIHTATSITDYSGKSFDLVLITVKSYDTATAAEEVAAFVTPETLILSLQNGLGNYEILQNAFGRERTLVGRVIFGARLPAPGEAEVTVYAEPVMIGSPDNVVDFEKIKQIAEQFSAAGVPTEATDQINQYIWGKMLYNCALNPLSAVLKVPYGGLLTHDCSKAIMRRVVEEIFRIAEAENVQLSWKTPTDYTEVLFGRLIPDTAGHYSSMLQDINAGKRTEISALNGEIVRRGGLHGIDTPINEMLVCLIDARESWIGRPSS